METASTTFAALGHEHRLRVYRHLLAQEGAARSAGALAQDLGVKPSTLSVYLRKLVDAGLVAQEVRATSRLYTALPDRLADVMAKMGGAGVAARDLPVRVRFVCRDGGARSRFAAAQLNRVGAPRFVAASGGIVPPRRDALADQVLRAAGHAVVHLQPALHPDVVIRLTRAPAPEPTGAGPLLVHWAVPDPAQGEPGVLVGVSRLGQLYRNLSGMVGALASLRVETLKDEALHLALMQIAHAATGGQTCERG